MIALGAVAVTAMLMAPSDIWPFVRDHLGIEWLSILQKLPKGRPDSAVAARWYETSRHEKET